MVSSEYYHRIAGGIFESSPEFFLSFSSGSVIPLLRILNNRSYGRR